MSRRDNVVSTYLTDDEKADLSRMVEDSEKSQSDIVRDALLEYLDHDRHARIEDNVRSLDEKVDRILRHLSDDTTHTHKDSTPAKRGSSATEKVRQIADRILTNHATGPDSVVSGDDVERAIEDYAGADSRTLRKYKRLLRKRGLLFEHPMDNRPLWTADTDQWTDWLKSYHSAAGPDAVESAVEPYPANVYAVADGIELDCSKITEAQR